MDRNWKSSVHEISLIITRFSKSLDPENRYILSYNTYDRLVHISEEAKDHRNNIFISVILGSSSLIDELIEGKQQDKKEMNGEKI